MTTSAITQQALSNKTTPLLDFTPCYSAPIKPHPACLVCFVLTPPKRWHDRHLIAMGSFSNTIATLDLPRYSTRHGSFQRTSHVAHGQPRAWSVQFSELLQ